MEITEAGNLKWYAQNGSYTKTIEYKKNDGEWTQITSSNAGTMISVAVGDIVQLRGNNEQYAPQDGRCSCWSGTTASYKLYGNIMSLVNSTGFTTLSSFTQPNVFMNFFNNSKCVDAENLILPATSLTNYCYQGFLAQNGNLLVGPLLPAETLVQGCYAYLFYHSNKVNNIRCLAINKSASNCLQDWVNRVQTTSGTFYKHPNMSSWNRGNSGVPNNWTIVDYVLHNIETDITAITGTYEASSYTVNLSSTSEWTATTIPSWVTLSTTAGTSGVTEITVTFSKNTSYLERTGTIVFTNAESDTCEVVCTQEKYPLLIPNENIYRADLEVVKGYRSGSTINKAYRSGELIYYKLNYSQPQGQPLTFNVISGGTISWRATSSAFTKEIRYSVNDGPWVSITSTTAGTPISLNTGDIVKFKGDGAISTSSSNPNRFRDSTIVFEVYGNIMSLIDSTGYTTATTAADHSFRQLFANQTGLTSAENLVLPATTIGTNVYKEMFKDCTSLASAPELPVATLAQSCYMGMFNGCTNLTTAPALPATTLASECYREMFRGCTSLTQVPSTLPATTLTDYCYQAMFSGCTSLTTAPVLPATTLVNHCYQFMFRGCTSLNYIKCLATDISANSCTNFWVYGVAASGTFVKNANMSSWRTGSSNGIPRNWTVQNA